MYHVKDYEPPTEDFTLIDTTEDSIEKSFLKYFKIYEHNFKHTGRSW